MDFGYDIDFEMIKQIEEMICYLESPPFWDRPIKHEYKLPIYSNPFIEQIIKPPTKSY